MKVIIDTDPGTDDALALMMAFNSPDLEILGLTTVGGNASLAHTTRNALRLIEYMGRSGPPVIRGAARPMRGSFKYAYYFHGPAGLTVRLPLPTLSPSPTTAADFIIEQTMGRPGEVTIIALGPLTNVARAMESEPRLRDWAKEVVVMGGAVGVPGNVTPYAEFNIYNDPVAARAVMSSGMSVRLIGLDVCAGTSVSRDEVTDFTGGAKYGKGAALAGRILSNWFKAASDRQAYSLCDPLAMAAFLEPGLLEYRRADVAVETDDDRGGKTSASYGDGPVRVAVGADVERAKSFISSLLRKA